MVWFCSPLSPIPAIKRMIIASIATIAIFLMFNPEPPLDFLVTVGLAFFSFLGLDFLTLSFLGTSFLISLVIFSVFAELNFLAGSFIPLSFCLNPSVAVLLNEGFELT